VRAIDGAALAEQVRRVPGVAVVYPARPLVAELVDTTHALLTGRRSAGPLRIEEDGGVTSVTALIGVADEFPAPETAAAVLREIEVALAAAGIAAHVITVRIGHIV
jgi:hypothetical protein